MTKVKSSVNADIKPKVGYLTVAGLNAAYLIKGSGKPVIMLHGWGGSKESWMPLMNELTDTDARIIAVDLPGFGESEEPPRGWKVEDYAHWFESFVTELYKVEGLKGDYDLIVHSFGGRILLKLADLEFEHSFKAKPRLLVLIAAAGIKPSRTIRLRVAAMAARFGKTIMGWPVLRRLAPLAQKVLYKVLRTHDYEKSSGVMRETFLNVIDEDLKDNLSNIMQPTLIIWGAHDRYVPLSDARIMNEKIAGSELNIIADGRHGIHKTHAKKVAEWVKKFINK